MESTTPRLKQSTGTNYCSSCKSGTSREDRGLNKHGTTSRGTIFCLYHEAFSICNSTEGPVNYQMQVPTSLLASRRKRRYRVVVHIARWSIHRCRKRKPAPAVSVQFFESFDSFSQQRCSRFHRSRMTIHDVVKFFKTFVQSICD